jgi:hypothetical protein
VCSKRQIELVDHICIAIAIGVVVDLVLFGYISSLVRRQQLVFETHIAFINTLSLVETTRMLRQNELL